MSGSEEEVEDGMEGADSDEENSDAELQPVEENYVCAFLQPLFVACCSSKRVMLLCMVGISVLHH